MRITVTHSTVYRYDFPRIPAGSMEHLDQDGNLATSAWFNVPSTGWNVTSRFTAEMFRQRPFDYVLIGESLALPLWYREPLNAAPTSCRNDGHVSESVKPYAKSTPARTQEDTLTFLIALSREIFQTCRQVVRSNGPPRPSYRTLNLSKRSCRDMAVRFCDACRVMGIAARFVSGYECETANRQDASIHAWAKVYLPGTGWRSYDLAVFYWHVVIGTGFDHDIASPLVDRYSATSRSHIEASIGLQEDNAG